jgi:putative MATE family efflux protein
MSKRLGHGRDHEYYRSLLTIALPITVQALISASLNLVDNVLVSGLGNTALAAVGLANVVFFILAIFLFGVSSGMTVFVAQYWGKKDLEGVRRATGLGVLVSGVLSLVFAVITAVFADELMRVFTNLPEVAALGAVFLRRIAPSYPLMAISFLFYASMRNTEHATPPILASTVAFVLNTVLNYTLIYGYFGAPRMGVQGSATATLVARVVEFGITLWIVYGRKLPSAVGLRHIFRIDPAFLASAMKISLPVMANEGIWVLGVSIYPAIYGRMGEPVIAAVNVMSTLERLSFVFAIGMGNAAAAIVGKQIGAGRKDLAYRYGRLSLLFGPLTGIVIGVAIFLSRPLVLPLFNLSGAALDNAMLVVALSAAFLWVRSFTMVCVVGVLRGGGDTVAALLLDVGPLWIVAVPLAMVGGLVFHWPLLFVYLAASCDEIIKLVLSGIRFLSKRWIHDLVNEPGAVPLPGTAADVPLPAPAEPLA